MIGEPDQFLINDWPGLFHGLYQNFTLQGSKILLDLVPGGIINMCHIIHKLICIFPCKMAEGKVRFFADPFCNPAGDVEGLPGIYRQQSVDAAYVHHPTHGDD